MIAFSANVWSYATAAESIHLWGRALRFYPHGEGETFLGVTATVLMLIAIAHQSIRRLRAARLEEERQLEEQQLWS